MRGDHGDQLRVLEHDRLDAGNAHRRPGEDDIGPTFDEHGDQGAHRRKREPHVDLGMVGDEGREPLRQSMRPHDASRRDGQLTALEGEVTGAQLLDLAHVLEDTNSELAKRTADIGELNVPTHALEQRETEGGFEAAHHPADRSLGEAERLGGGRHVLAFGNREKGVQLIQRDPGPRMTRTRLRRAHCGVSRETPVPGGGRLRRRRRARRRRTHRRSGCRCRRSRRVPPAPRTDRRYP